MLILASASPRRQELISLISSDATVHPSMVDETVPDGISPDAVPEFLAVKKASDIAAKFQSDTVVGADTVVIVDNEILGKPKDRKDAFRMLKLLSGKTHKVITGCAIFKGNKSISFSETTLVTFYSLTDEEINSYVDTNEPMDKAGAYGIQGIGSLLVKEIHGDYFNVVGLPVAKLNKALKKI